MLGQLIDGAMPYDTLIWKSPIARITSICQQSDSQLQFKTGDVPGGDKFYLLPLLCSMKIGDALYPKWNEDDVGGIVLASSFVMG